MDPGTIAAIVAAVLAFTGPILGKLWAKIKSFYGRACKTPDYLRQLDRNKFTADLQTMLSSNAALLAAVQNHYLAPGRQAVTPQSQKSPAQITYVEVDEYHYGSDFSDLDGF